MSLRRRDLLQAAAVSPAFVLLPSLARPATAVGSAVDSGSIISASGLEGLSLSWRGADHRSVATVEARVRGIWAHSVAVYADHGHGPVAADGRNHGPLVVVPGADAYRVVASPEADELRQHLLEFDQSLAAQALVPDPEIPTEIEPVPGLKIIERQNWTYRSRTPAYDCMIGSSVYGVGCRSDVGLRHGTVHHTVNVNDYAPADVPELLRGIQRYHMDTRGWNDIAYNYVIDRFGRIWQARQAELDQPITGGHTTGLNAESVGIAVLGTFTEEEPSVEVVDSLGRLLGWRLATHGVDPLGMTEVRSTGSELADPGELIRLHNVSGHSDNQTTTCPGARIYQRLPEIRAIAAELVPVFGHLQPSYTFDYVGIEGWAIDRFDPLSAVAIDVTLDGESHDTLTAVDPVIELDSEYPEAGAAHGFALDIPIDLDTRSITATARATDGRTASLMDLKLFAGFIDVEPHRFFAPSVYFLRQHDLTTGTVAGLFEPMDRVTRAQMATFLHRFMGTPEPTDQAPFDDVERPSWYSDAVDWLATSGITTGTSPTTYSPGDFVTRGQMATFLWRLCGTSDAPDPPFTDLELGRYYVPAVAWLAAHEITTGTSPDTFSPAGTLTRGEMATFLHRLALNPEVWDRTPAPPVAIATQAA